MAIEYTNAARDVQYVLSDERNLVHKMTLEELMLISKEMASASPGLKKFALVGSTGDRMPREMFAGFSALMGFRMDSFTNMEDAKEWLLAR